MGFYDKLDTYFEMFNETKKLNIKEAKLLVKSLKENKDEKEKNKLREELLMGTINQVYNFIKENDLLSLCEIGYIEFDDLVSSLILAWIENLEEELLNVGRFSTLFSRDYFENVAKRLGVEDLSDTLKIRGCLYIGALASYYRDKDNGNEVSPFFDYTFATGFECNEEQKKKTVNIIDKGYQLYKEFGLKESDNTALLGFYGMIFTSIVLRNGKYDRADDFTFEDRICDKLDVDDIIYDSFIISEQSREVLIQRFGFDGLGEKTLDEVGLNLGLTKCRISQICNKSLKKIRKNLR